eukprot:TRINITY_DN6317_c0_g1_i1.p1 TRINITY_DN6317_c0_g1~~TRINITY_DN6317_c0_g1_i1.p1  ORF type:complete len:165 (+),score=41.87 TRINITY_DN6317_c0_g1_i1:102-596(+)
MRPEEEAEQPLHEMREAARRLWRVPLDDIDARAALAEASPGIKAMAALSDAKAAEGRRQRSRTPPRRPRRRLFRRDTPTAPELPTVLRRTPSRAWSAVKVPAKMEGLKKAAADGEVICRDVFRKYESLTPSDAEWASSLPLLERAQFLEVTRRSTSPRRPVPTD